MINSIRDLFETTGFVPRWQCGDWSAGLGWLHILSDLGIFGAYFAIPLSLLYFMGRRKDVPLRGIFWLFAGFILFCGTTHLIEAIIFWEPIYRFAGWVKLATAIISWTTVIALVRLMPTAVTLPSIRAVNLQLREEIDERQRLEDELVRARDMLEQRSASLTQRDHRANNAMAAADACALKWSIETNDVEWHIGGENILKLLNRDHRPLQNWRDVLPEATAEQLREEARAALASKKLSVDYDVTDPRVGRVQFRIVACPENESAQGGAMVGMFRLVMPKGTCD